jgi:diacylglycerol kinase
LASPELHPIAGQAKDVAAAGVLLASVAALVVGALVFVPKLM